MDLSVIFPLLHVRGPTRTCIESWTRKQSLEPTRFEVIVVSPGVDRDLERLVGEYLRPHDRIEVIDSRELYTLYDHGIRAARGRIALITESHVQAGHKVLERLLEVFERSGCRAACCRAVAPKREGYLATMEGRLFEEEVASWGEHGHRRRLLERGFAIRRDTYLEYGGFPHEYGLYSGRIFGARLEAADEPVPYVRQAAVVHHNSTKLDDIFEGVRSFVHGELRYCRDGDATQVRRYFAPPQILDDSDVYRRALARQWLRGRLAIVADRRVMRARDLREIARLANGAVFGFAWALESARAAVWLTVARIHLARPLGASAGLAAFRDLWHRRLIYYHGLDFVAQTADDDIAGATDRYEACDATGFVGFHAPETLGNIAFRWSKPLAALRVRLATPAPSRVTLRLLPVGAPPTTRGLALYFDGRRLESLRLSEDGVELSAEIRKTGEASATRILTIVCDPLATEATHDPRELGIAVCAVEFDRDVANTSTTMS